MDFLFPYHSFLDYNAKIVTLLIFGVLRVEWKGASGSYPRKVISFLRAKRLVDGGYLLYLAFIYDTILSVKKKDGTMRMCIDYRTEEDLLQNLMLVLQRLREEKFFTKFSKCEFWLDSMEFLGHMVAKKGIRTN
ncbi:hypothetical protein KY285_020095 [Solanum tuberosum]|nr:hypothetical protein KY289_020340 [Solanum tuberosum]KAH0692998.1 hypothetical protein KY285_020095 [Solanum tuberosum]